MALTQALADAAMHPNSLQRGMLVARLTLSILRVVEVGELEERLQVVEDQLRANERVKRLKVS